MNTQDASIKNNNIQTHTHTWQKREIAKERKIGCLIWLNICLYRWWLWSYIPYMCINLIKKQKKPSQLKYDNCVCLPW